MNPLPPFVTVPLLSEPAAPHGWRQVRAPGGYETWRFEAEDDAGDLRCVAELVEGCSLHGGYLGAYRAYRRKPTRVAPPLPADWPCVHFSVFHGAERVAQLASGCDGARFSASVDSAHVEMGPATVMPQEDGSLRLVLADLPLSKGHGRIAADFTFTPRGGVDSIPRAALFPRPQVPLATPTRWGGEHWWLGTGPQCAVQGWIRVRDPKMSSPAHAWKLQGRGFCDRVFGTAPPGCGLQRMMRGRLLLRDQTLAFQVAVMSGSNRTIAHLMRADPTGSSIRTVAAAVDWDGLTMTRMRYPVRVSLDGGILGLINPVVLGAQPRLLQLKYSSPAAGGATALCEVVYPPGCRSTATIRFCSDARL